MKQLREIRSAMMDSKYLLELEKLPIEKQREAAFQLSNVQLAYLKLRNAQLSDIRDKLTDNEKELKSGIESLQKTLGDLKNVEAILGAGVSFLKVVGRIVKVAIG